MNLPLQDDFRAVESLSSVSAGIGAHLGEETRMYGSIYLGACQEFRHALFEHTALAWDLSSPYPTFMCMVSPQPLLRVQETIKYKNAVCAMVAAAYSTGREGWERTWTGPGRDRERTGRGLGSTLLGLGSKI